MCLCIQNDHKRNIFPTNNHMKLIFFVFVSVKPNITSNKPNYTQVAGKVEGSSSLVCIVLAVPNAEIWWTRENEAKKLQPSDDRVLSINVAEFSQTLRIKVKNVGEDYYCHARNIMGYAKQKYTIREHGNYRNHG